MKQEFVEEGSKWFADRLLNWYEINQRDLPWRNTTDPYIVWLSEIILQQTRVQQGLPYFLKFLHNYPYVGDFAAADEREVLNLWQGLGYYSRARNMIKCAQTIMEEHRGVFPGSARELIKLSGIGKYTAAAIASFCYRERIPVIDGNVYRVISRVFGMEQDISETTAYDVFARKSHSLMSDEHPDLYNQAIMEFGALQCIPRNPDCESCIFKGMCVAYVENTQSYLPVKSKKVKKRNRYFNYIVVKYKSQLLLNHRTEKDIWTGLYDFLNFESGTRNGSDNSKNLEWDWMSKYGKLVRFPNKFKHVLTHQLIHTEFFLLETGHKKAFNTIKDKFDLISVSIDELDNYPNPILIDKFLKSYIL